MHDPSILVFDVRPLGLDVWHDEPGGHDSGEVCGRLPQRIPQRLLWAVRHARHLHYRWWPYLNVKRWIVNRCDGCGQRFHWRDARHSYQSTDRVWHDPCMSLRHVRGQLDDLTGYVLGTADQVARWRASYRLEGVKEIHGQPDQSLDRVTELIANAVCTRTWGHTDDGIPCSACRKEAALLAGQLMAVMRHLAVRP